MYVFAAAVRNFDFFLKTFHYGRLLPDFDWTLCQSLASEEQQSRILFGGTIPVGLVRIYTLRSLKYCKIFDELSNL